MNVVRWAVESVQRKGVVRTKKIAANVAMDLQFDLKYGTDTMRWVDRSEISTHSGNKAHSAPYRATKVRPLLALLRQLDLPRECVFVDIGSGKGRVLLIASMYGFSKVVGIEFSGPLCLLARRNIDTFRKRVALPAPIEVIEADAVKYTFPFNESVIFMYNPFDASILKRVVDNLRESLRSSPRKIWLIYNTPMHHDIIAGSGLFQSNSLHEIGGNQFLVYQN